MKDEKKLESLRIEASKSEKERKIVFIKSMRCTLKLLLDVMIRVRHHPFFLMDGFEIEESYKNLFSSIESQCSLPEFSIEDYPESDVTQTFLLVHELHSRGVEYLFSSTPDYQNIVDPVFLRLLLDKNILILLLFMS